jgi:E3 ubiquitin-protein ligase DOA10
MELLEEEKEVAYCRVCHGESEPDNQLFFPCKCDGSIKYVHQECLEQWLKVSNKQKCELCGEVFHFQKVYKTDAPYHISLLDVVLEVVPRALAMVQYSVVMLIAMVLWGVCLPVFTNWWLKTCWCIIVSADRRCLTRAPAFVVESSLEGLVTYWYFGLVNVCIIIAASVVSFEIGHSLYRVGHLCPPHISFR